MERMACCKMPQLNLVGKLEYSTTCTTIIVPRSHAFGICIRARSIPAKPIDNA